MAKDMKFTAKLDNQVSAEVNKIIGDLNKLAKQTEKAGNEAARALDKQDAMTRRILRQAEIEQAKLVEGRFNRMLAVQQVKHKHMLDDLKGNLAAQEAEQKRHAAIMARIRMDEAAFPNTPFQQMLRNFDKLNNKLAGAAPALGIVEGKMASAGFATGSFGAALSAFSLGPLGVALVGITALSTAINAVIATQEKAVARMQAMPKTITDPKALDQLIAYAEKIEATKNQRGMQQGEREAQKAFAEATGRDYFDTENHWNLERLRAQKAALDKSVAFKKDHADVVLELERALNEARAASSGSEEQKRIAQENSRHAESLAKVKDNHRAVELEEALHLQNLANIRQDAEQKAFDDELKKDLAADKKFAEGQRKEMERRKQLAEIDLRADEEKTRRVEANQAKIVEAERRAAELRGAYQLQLVNAVGQATQAMLGKNKAAFYAGKGIAAAEIVMNMLRGEGQALAMGPAGLPLIPLIKAIGFANLATLAATTIRGYQHGTDFSPGGRYLVGERGPEEVTLPRGSKVTPAHEVSRGVTHTGNVVLNIHMGAGATREQGAAAGAAAADSYMATLKEHARRNRDVVYHNVKV